MKKSTAHQDSNHYYINNDDDEIIFSSESNIINFSQFHSKNNLSPFLIESNIERLRHVITDDELINEKDKKIQDIVSSNHDEVIQFQKKILKELEESRKEHKKLEEQITTLSGDIAEKNDIIIAKEQIIENIKTESEKIQSVTTTKTDELKKALYNHLPHKRTLNVSLYFLTLFSACFFANLFLGLTIIERFWNLLGISISSGFILLSISLHKDWIKSVRNK